MCLPIHASTWQSVHAAAANASHLVVLFLALGFSSVCMIPQGKCTKQEQMACHAADDADLLSHIILGSAPHQLISLLTTASKLSTTLGRLSCYAVHVGQSTDCVKGL